MKKRKKRKKNAPKKSTSSTKKSRSAAAKKGWRKRKAKAAKRKSNPAPKRKRRSTTKTTKSAAKRKSNPAPKRKRRSSKRSSSRRRKNPVTVTLDFQNFTDALPATIAGGVGFTLGGIIDAVAGGRVSEKIAELFAGKDAAGKQKRPSYRERAQGEAVLDAGTFFGLWMLTDRFDALEPYRTPILIGSGIRVARSLVDAIISPAEPTGIGAGMRRILDLPAIQTRALRDPSKLPGDKVVLVSWDYRLKAYVGADGKPVTYTVATDGVGQTADGKMLVDADSGQIISHGKGYLGAPMEEWDLALNGPRAGYEMGSVYEDWSAAPALPAHAMNGYEDWNEVHDMGAGQEDAYQGDFGRRF